MVYLLSLFICMFCLYYYDVKGRTYKRNLAYRCLLVWFIALSGLQYMVGTDVESYMLWYKELNPDSFSISELISENKQYQPGWMALGYLCKFISEDYVLLKLIQAVFVNIAVFSFFKRETRYVFVSIFLYALMSYLVVNFNLMRQSIALGFALYGFTSLRLKDYYKYYFFVFLAYLFHNSAIILLPIPLLTLFNYNNKNASILICGFVAILFLLSYLNIENILVNMLFSGYLGDSISEAGLAYMGRDRLGVQSSFSIFSIHRLLMIVAIIYYMRKYKDPYYGALGLFYLTFMILTGFLPILWRFRLFFDFSYYIILAKLIVEYPKTKKGPISSFVLSAIMMIVLYFPLREYFLYVENSQYRNIDQYNPYHSIFDKQHDVKKQNFFDSLTL